MVGGASRPKSARPPPSSRSVTYPIRPQSAQMLPSVVIQGTAISKPSSGVTVAQVPSQAVSTAPPSSSIREPPSEENLQSASDRPAKATAKPNVKMEDKSVNVPSIIEESEGPEPTDAEGQEEVSEVEDGQQAQIGDNVGEVEVPAEEKVGEQAERPSTAKGKKVRFAEDDTNGADEESKEVEESDRVRFFLTEEKNLSEKELGMTVKAGEELVDSEAPCQKADTLSVDDGTEEIKDGTEEVKETDIIEKLQVGEELKGVDEDIKAEIGQGEGGSLAEEEDQVDVQYETDVHDEEKDDDAVGHVGDTAGNSVVDGPDSEVL